MFDLTNNAFFLLKAEFSSSTMDISELVEDAEFDGRSSLEELQRAQRELVAPASRVKAELSWLPELSSSQVVTALTFLEQNDTEQLLAYTETFPSLAKANLIAHLLGRTFSSQSVETLIHVWNEVETTDLMTFLNEMRRRASLPDVQEEQVHDQIAILRQRHAKVAAAAIWKTADAGKIMTDIVETEIKFTSNLTFLGLVIHAYDKESEPKLSTLAASIDEQITAAEKVDETLSKHIATIKNLLHKWDEINQPVQLYQQAQGQEERRSKKIFEKLRSLSLDLANNHGRHSEARRLSEALLSTFPELISVAETLKSDISVLDEIMEAETHEQKLQPLIESCERAKRDPLKLRKALIRYGFMPYDKGLLKDIVAAYDNASEVNIELACAIIRNLSLFLNNDLDDTETAFRFIHAFLEKNGDELPENIFNILHEGQSTLLKNWKIQQLKRTGDNLKAAISILDDLIYLSEEEERNNFINLKSALERRVRQRKAKLLLMAGIAVVVAVVALSNYSAPHDGISSRPPSSTAYDRTQDSTGNITSVNTAPPPVTRKDTSTSENSRFYTAGEVTRCFEQEKFLEYLRQRVNGYDENEVARFNNLINAYNSRCGSYQYDPADLDGARQAVVRMDGQIRSDVETTITAWRTHTAPAQEQPAHSQGSETPSPTANTTTDLYRYITDTDLYGGDLTQDGYKNIQLSQCEAICTADDECRGYTYLVSKSWCWPKSSETQTITGKKGLVSAMKSKSKPPQSPKTSYQRLISTDLYGGDLTPQGVKGLSVAQCELLCTTTSGCRGYTYFSAQSQCWLKSENVRREYGKAGLTSGIQLN